MKKTEIIVLCILLFGGIIYYNSWTQVNNDKIPEFVYLKYNSAQERYMLHLVDDGSPLVTFKRKRFYLKSVEREGSEITIKFSQFSEWK